MRLLVKNGQFAEVLVQGHQDPGLRMGELQNFGVSGVFSPPSGPHHVVTGCYQRFYISSPNAGIQEEVQSSDSITSGSIRSLPITRRA